MSGCIDWKHCSLCSIGVEDQCDNLLGIEVASFILRSGWYVKIQVPRENLCDTNDRLHALLRQKINKWRRFYEPIIAQMRASMIQLPELLMFMPYIRSKKLRYMAWRRQRGRRNSATFCDAAGGAVLLAKVIKLCSIRPLERLNADIRQQFPLPPSSSLSSIGLPRASKRFNQ